MAIRKIISRSIGVDVIAAEDLAAGSVETAEIQNGAVTTAKLATQTGNVDFADNGKIRLGDSQDLQIYHDGTASWIEDAGTGYLKIASDGAGILLQKGGSETMAQFLTDGAVNLFYDNAAKLATANTGVSITGTAISTTTGASSAPNFAVTSGALGVNGMFAPAANTLAFATSATERMRIDSNGRLLVGATVHSVSSSQKFEVQGGISLFQVDSSSIAPIVIKNTDQTAAPGSPQIIIQDGGGNRGAIYRDSSNVLGIHGQGGVTFHSSSTAPTTERMRISSNGAVGINSTSTNTMLHINSSTAVNAGNAGLTNFIDQTNRVSNYRYHNASAFSSFIYLLYTNRSQNSAYSFMKMGSAGASDIEFSFRGDGQAYADASWNGGGADYAEYFEWADGNTTNEDRRGYTVVLDGNMIRKATDEDDASQIIGAVSATPCVIGDHADNKWSDKYLKDDFGNYLYDEHNAVEWTEIITDEEGNETEKRHSYEDWKLPVGIEVPDDATVLTHDAKGNRLKHRRLNPDFDSDVEYITRENRPEWTPIGMMGKLRIRKGQPMGDRWIKMRDVSETVEEWLVR